MMQTTTWQMILRAEDPIAHSMGNIGNKSMIMTKKIGMPDGTIEEVPYITGDCLRHGLRETAAYATLHAANMLDDPQLDRGALRFLFNGGMITGKGDGSTFKVNKYRELVILFPPLALFGGCTDARALPGQIDVWEGNLVCSETLHLLPKWVGEWANVNLKEVQNAWEMIEEVQRVRMDPELLPEKIKLLTEADQIVVHNKAAAMEVARENDDALAVKESKSAMLPRTHERFLQGSLFCWGVTGRTYTDLELDAFSYIMACYLANMKVGGMARSGHGRMRVVEGRRVHQLPMGSDIESLGEQLTAGVGSLYRAHVQERSEDLRKWLTSTVNS
ncbi:MAG: hypothetical protein ABFD89_17845 [Bryobacteraceae bacterium]